MNLTLMLIIAVLVALCVVLFIQSTDRKAQIDLARKEADQAHHFAIEGAQRIAQAAGLDATEFAEMMVEQTSTVKVSSDAWEVELPYGKWVKFPDDDGDPSPEIRGFWLDFPGRIIGVRMPVGAKYIMHRHHWAETLIGGLGLVMVEVEQPDGRYKTYPLGPDDVITIPPNVNHAVARATVHSEFTCIWGVPK